jgi:hypothetical protein
MPSARATAPSPAQTITYNADWLSIFRRPMLSDLRSRSPEGIKFPSAATAALSQRDSDPLANTTAALVASATPNSSMPAGSSSTATIRLVSSLTRHYAAPFVLAAGGGYSLCSIAISMAVRLNQFDLAPENLTTFRHFSVSSSMNVAEPAGELASTVAPKLASLATIPGSASAALISLLSA